MSNKILSKELAIKLLYHIPSNNSSIVKLLSTKDIEIDDVINYIEKILFIERDSKVRVSLNRMINILYDDKCNQHKEALYDTIENKNIQFNKEGKVLLTMTSCKRFDLLQRTINSMLYNIKDISSYIKRWIIVDDNSSEEDRKEMKEKYPFLEFIMKDESMKGHPKSMNMIRDIFLESKCEYLFHIEDDFEFYRKDNYIKRCIKILETSELKLGQILLNNDYSEDQITANQLGGSEEKRLKDNTIYFVHRYYKNENDIQRESQKLGLRNQFYWPHFSFRPGLTKREVLLNVGEFNENTKHFEMEYAYRYVEKGYLTGFLERMCCTHIGRRTYERNTNKKNAYDLNDQVQFGEKVKKEVKEEVKEEFRRDALVIDTVVINLERRKDRLLKFIKNNNSQLHNLRVFKAIDGKNIKPNQKIQQLFSTGDFNYRAGIVGVAMSHIMIWKELLKDEFSTHALVLEDDIKLVSGFKEKILHVLSEHVDNFDILIMHWNPYQHSQHFVKKDIDGTINVVRWNRQEFCERNMGSAACYLINKKGAYNLLKEINEKGVYNGIDWVMHKTADKQKICVTEPMLGIADCWQSGRADTDIQLVYDSVGYTSIEKAIYDELIMMKEKMKVKGYYVIGECDMLRNCAKDAKLLLSKNKFPDTILFNSTTSFTSENITIYPSEIFQKLNIDIDTEPVEWYKVMNYIIIVPHRYITEEVLKSRVWRSNLLNEIEP